MKTKVVYAALIGLLAACFALPAMAQTVTAAVTGVVTDPSGAVVPRATVIAENTATGVQTTAQTNDTGAYTIRFLPIGTYTLNITAKAFAPAKVNGITLEINQTATVNVAMKISTAETTVVNETVHPILDTQDATLGNTLSTNEIQNIPLNGRNFSSLTLYEPGSVNTDPSGLTGGNAIERNTFNNGIVAVNGNRQQANNYTIEGADDNEPQNNLIGYNPAPDAIAQVRVISGNANATYGNANGGTVVTVLKSGTNNFHGSMYEFLQSQILDANTWSNNHKTPIIPKNSYTQNIFGGTIGGPIVRNRLFFFADYEGIRHHTGGTSSASLLTPAMLAGNFGVLNASGIQLYDTQNGFSPYAGNQVPVTNPVAQYLAAHPELYPAPNSTPTDGLIADNFQGPQSSYISNNQEDVKVDWTPTDANRINGFYSQGTGSDFTTALIPVFFPAHNHYPTKIAGASFVHTFSPSIINEFRLGFTRVRWLNGVPSDPSGQFGLAGDQKVGIPFGTQQYVGFTGQSINTANYVGTNANPQVFTDNTFNYYDNLTWQHGRHYFSIGGQATRYQQNYLNAGNVGFLGQFSYNGIFTSDPNAANGPGYGPADFVLGRIQNVQLASPLGWVGNRQWRLAGYVQDDLKLTARLTLNLGIRYEYDQPWYEQNNKTANVLPGGIVEYAGHVPALAAPGSIVCKTRACYDANYNQFMPRLGFAYQATSKLVIRGGYGATSFFEGYSFNQRLTSSPPFSLAINTSATTPSTTSGGTPFTVGNAFSQPLGINNSLYSVWPQNTQPSYIHQFTLMTEYALTNELSLSAGYHGQVGHHLADYRNGNQLTLAQAPGVAAILKASNGDCTVAFPTALQTPYYPLVGECNPVLITESQARMTYNAAQVTLRQRTHHGLEYTVNYTFAKSLTNSSGNYSVANTSFNGSSHQNGYDINGDYGPSAMDIRNSLNLVGVYELPFGHGRAYGSNSNRVVDGALGGWKISTSALFYSGFPVTIFANGNSNTNSWGFSRANQYRPMVIKNRSINQWWGTDPSATPCLNAGVDNGICAYGNAGDFTFGTAHNSTERGPGYRQVDLSLFKDFSVWHEQVVGFRVDFFNAFNIASYGNPDNNINDSSFGLISNTRSPARSIQLGLHYQF
ncbi:MAG TPA: TonB-dependent receptor [Terriglobales bacterium]|nr:TonB-dependent receptor [Terriglobales bacterium]